MNISLELARKFLADILRFNLVLDSSVTIPVRAMQFTVGALTFFFPIANALQAISLILENLGDSLLS